MEDSRDGRADTESRLLFLDFFRGCVMFLLIAEATGFYDLLVAPALEGTFVHAIGLQFQHHPWNGLRAWDLGLPFFMFISGVAMAISYQKRRERGKDRGGNFRHALGRSCLLFLLGWALYRITPVESNPGGAFLYDILPHLAVGGLVAFLVLRRKAVVQMGLSLGPLVLTELLYRLWAVPGFDRPFSPDHNFGAHIDLLLTGELSEGHWVAFNIVPAAAFMIWGVFAGQVLLSRRSQAGKVRALILAGLAGVTAGMALSPVTPVIRRICTSSFALVSGGLAMLALALAFWLIDVMKIRKGALFFTVVGMNPLFIYLFTQSGGAEWFRGIAEPFSVGLGGWMGEWPAQVLTSLAIWGLLWFVCYGLYRKKVFIRI